MNKRILIIKPDGSERLIDPAELGKNGLPSLRDMQTIVGGYIELVRVLRADLPDSTFTYMVVNEEGLLKGLPDNPKATDIYLANVRRAFPDSAAPWEDAKRAFRVRFPAGTAHIDITPEPYKNKPPVVVGTVIWFDGYTCDELLGMGL